MIFLKNEIIFIFQNCKKMNDPKTQTSSEPSVNVTTCVADKAD